MKARAIQLLCLAGAVALALVLRRAEPQRPATPEAAVNALFDAAARGDDGAYLALTAGELAASLRRARSQAGDEAFRAELRRSAAGILGLALSRRDDGPKDAVALDVELIFADRNERQRIVLAGGDEGWAVVEMHRAATTRPAVPYGTSVLR
jgi:hypothetical protein